MEASRISRLEEKRAKKQFIIVLLGIAAILIFTITIGIPLVVRSSVFLGNLKSKQPLTTDQDVLAPLPPILSTLPDAVNSSPITVEGYGEPESTLSLIVNGEEQKNVLLGNDGSFSFSDIELTEGTNTISAQLTDSAGNESSLSREHTVIYKKDAPKLEISQPEEGKTFGKNEQEIEVKGKTDIGVNIAINDRFVRVLDDGTFIFKLKLQDGENVINIVAHDDAGNETKIERKVIFTP